MSPNSGTSSHHWPAPPPVQVGALDALFLAEHDENVPCKALTPSKAVAIADALRPPTGLSPPPISSLLDIMSLIGRKKGL